MLRPKDNMRRKLEYLSEEGPIPSSFSLIRAAYEDDIARARDILEADPTQIITQDPFAGLTALHIAIFRQNVDMVRLLATHPSADLTIVDNFGRIAADMLDYTRNSEIFELVMYATYPDEMGSLDDVAYEDGLASGAIVPLKPRGPN